MSAPSTLSLLLVALCLLHTGLAQQCPDDGYEVFPSMPGSRYKIAPFLLNWTDAIVQCQSDGGGSSLVVINSDTEAAVVRTLIARLTSSGLLSIASVGISDIETEGDWRTVQGGLVSESGYNKWARYYPLGGAAWNCGLADRDAQYFDDPCSMLRNIICEKPNV